MSFTADHNENNKEAPLRLNVRLWRKLLGYSRPYWKDLALLFITMALVSAIDVIWPLVTRHVIDEHITPGTTSGLGRVIAVYIVLMILQTALCYAFQYFAIHAEYGICYTIRDMSYRHLQALPFSYYDKTPAGTILSRLTSDCARLGETIGWALCDIGYSITYIVLAGVSMLSLSRELTGRVLLVIPVLAVLSWVFQRKILKAQRKVRKTNSRITAAFNEGILGAATSKTLPREEENVRAFGALTGRMHALSMRSATLSGLFLPLVITLSSAATSYALWAAGLKVYAGIMTVGTMQVFISYTLQFFDPIRGLAITFSDILSAQAAAERVVELLETEPEIADSPEILAKYGDALDPHRENWPEMKGRITFEKVSFHYGQGSDVLRDFSLDVQPGQTVALVGPTGAGKSTVVNLACRFYEPVKGRILIDGVDYRERSQLWLQSHLGYVLQEPRLFSGTIADNIRYGRLDATDEEIKSAAKMVNAHDLIMNKEKGYDTPVGEGGALLSTGEKQLISFARAILADPVIFVLDEATSSVDTDTERIIQEAITHVLSGRTAFIIAHRLSTIRNADQILYIDDGRILEQGRHEELMRLKGKYYQLYTSQFALESTLEALKGSNDEGGIS